MIDRHTKLAELPRRLGYQGGQVESARHARSVSIENTVLGLQIAAGADLAKDSSRGTHPVDAGIGCLCGATLLLQLAINGRDLGTMMASPLDLSSAAREWCSFVRGSTKRATISTPSRITLDVVWMSSEAPSVPKTWVPPGPLTMRACACLLTPEDRADLARRRERLERKLASENSAP